MTTTTISRHALAARTVLVAAGAATAAGLIAASVAGDTAARTGLLVAGCVLGTSSAVPAVHKTLRGREKPPLVMWATWAALAGLAGAASLAAGDYPAAAFSLVGAAACGTVVMVAVRVGTWAPSRLDAVCLLLIVPGLGLWLTLDRPAIAVITACLIDGTGAVSALPGLWREPDLASAATYALIAAGGLCTACAAWGTWTVTALAYPLYVAASTAAMALLCLRTRTPGTAPDPSPDPGRRTTATR
jgi:hypothetical protein